MITDTYKLYTNNKATFFFFNSIGENGTIPKAILITHDSQNKWNLAFGDVIDNDFSDSSISNNNDVAKVMGTVAKAAMDFLEKYPDRVILIRPVDLKRKRLYNVVFQRRHIELEEKFQILGKRKGRWSKYSSDLSYEKFQILIK
jgi:hypothetical protein